MRVAQLAAGRATNDPRPAATDQVRGAPPGQAEPDARHQERRDRLDRDRDAEVGRAPDDVEDEHPEPERCRGRRPEVAGSVGIARWSKWRSYAGSG